MVRTQIQFPKEDLDALHKLAAEEGISTAELVRRGMKQVIAESRKPSRRELMERASQVVGKFRSGVSDLSERHDDYFAEAIENGHVPGHVRPARASR
jgi:hypothetical protein